MTDIDQALADAGCAGRVVSIELDPGYIEKARGNLLFAGLGHRVELLCGDSRQRLTEVAAAHAGIRFALLDASHLYNDVLAEFETLLPALADDAVVAFDNTWRIAEPHEDQRGNGALKTILARHGGNCLNLEFVSWYTPGLALWQRRPAL